MIISGNSISSGLAEGMSFILDTNSLLRTALGIPVQLSVKGELERLQSAQSCAVAQLETMERLLTTRGNVNDAAIFQTHATLLMDEQLMRRMRRLFIRARPDKNEINILRGILTAVDKTREN